MTEEEKEFLMMFVFAPVKMRVPVRYIPAMIKLNIWQEDTTDKRKAKLIESGDFNLGKTRIVIRKKFKKLKCISRK